MLNSKGDLNVCTSGNLLRMVLVYRLIHLRKKVPTSELPGFKSLLRAHLLHHAFWVFQVKSWMFTLFKKKNWRNAWKRLSNR